MNLVLVGAQWGREGIPEILPSISADASVIIQFGSDSPRGDDLYASLAAVAGTVILGAGVPIEPGCLFQFLDEHEARFLVSSRAHLSLPSYEAWGNETVTALRWVGEGVRVHQLFDGSLDRELSDEDRHTCDEYRQRLRDLLVDTTEFFRHAGNERILHVGTRGVMSDGDLGAYPHNRIGGAAAAVACTSAGIGPTAISHVLGVSRSFTSVSGDGEFPAEETRDPGFAARLRTRLGGGRPDADDLRVGSLDLVALRYACASNSVDALALTALDAVAGEDTVRACVAYEDETTSTVSYPASAAALGRYRAVTKSFRGWPASIGDATDYDELPCEAKEFIEFVEEFVETPIDIVSVGSSSDQIIVRRKPWIES